MPKTTFIPGTPIKSAWLNAIQNLTFDDLVEDGHLPRLANDALSNTPGNLKPEWTAFRDEHKVTAAAGLNINYTGGGYTIDTGLKLTIAPGTLALPPSSVSYVFIDNAGTVGSSTIIPSRWCVLAQVSTNANAVTAVFDLRERLKYAPVARAIPVFGGGGYEGDLIISTNTTISGSSVRFLRNFTVNAGVTLTVTGGMLYIKASGNVNIQGTIVISPVVAGGAGFSGSTASPYLFAGEPGAGIGRAGGHNIGPSPAYPYQLYTTSSSGGSSGLVRMLAAGGSADITIARGGLGGGSIFIEAAGTITVSGTITADGGGATAPSIINPSSVSQDVMCTGACGGTGGVIWLASLISIVATAAATFSCRGGNSSIAAKTNIAAGVDGAGGSSGGYQVFQAPSVSINAGATTNVSGGVGGAGVAGTGYLGSVSGSSFANMGGVKGSNGAAGTSGGVGQIIQQSFSPI